MAAVIAAACPSNHSTSSASISAAGGPVAGAHAGKPPAPHQEQQRYDPQNAKFRSHLQHDVVALAPWLLAPRRVVILELPGAHARERVLEERVERLPEAGPPGLP